jgi:hypothetical protein
MTKRNITNRGNTHQKAIVKATSKATSIFLSLFGFFKATSRIRIVGFVPSFAFEAQKREGNEVFFCVWLLVPACLPAFDVGEAKKKEREKEKAEKASDVSCTNIN